MQTNLFPLIPHQKRNVSYEIHIKYHVTNHKRVLFRDRVYGFNTKQICC